MQHLTDEELAAKVQTGDIAAFEKIVEKYEKPLLSYARYLSGNRECAEDAVQEAFLNAFRNIQSFDTGKKFSSWIYRIVHNEAISLIRKRKKTVTMDEIPEVADDTNIAHIIQKKIDTPQNAKIINDAYSKLPLKYKDVVYLRFYSEKSYDEIAEILHLPASTVGTYLLRAKNQLKDKLKNINIEELL
ncbi:MAG: RNA polymerase sigma factor [candidate division CPR2 bacterium GW2011_GWC2_39_10]|uniref:RNA polymerase sigma factor n=1 Tax=candidate division CPR2 bacterium GW2011_GWC2_39_10 TaxID=1618345 RepID=A0A0G0P9A1_UNCC2|nr:MAG: RNA polymerase sigma factor [candidate division CPR2 bacterium GW2011_GWC2_39_10]